MTNEVGATIVFAVANLAAVVFTAIGAFIASFLVDVIYTNYGKLNIKWRWVVFFEVVSAVFFAIGGTFALHIGKALHAPGPVSVAVYFGIAAATGIVYVRLTKVTHKGQTTIVDFDTNESEPPVTDNFQ